MRSKNFACSLISVLRFVAHNQRMRFSAMSFDVRVLSWTQFIKFPFEQNSGLLHFKRVHACKEFSGFLQDTNDFREVRAQRSFIRGTRVSFEQFQKIHESLER